MSPRVLLRQIVAGGNIIVANQLEMQGMQKTFSVALSRDMVPSAHIVAYYMHQGEILADSLNFFVNGTRQNPVGTHTAAIYKLTCTCLKHMMSL